MILGIYCYRDDISQILSGVSLHTSDDVAVNYLGASNINLLLGNIDSFNGDFDTNLIYLKERFSHLSIIKVGEFNILTGEVKNIDNLVIYNNENMLDLFNALLNKMNDEKGDDTDV